MGDLKVQAFGIGKLLLIFALIALGLSGCTSDGPLITVQFESGDGMVSKTFTPENVNCSDGNAFGFGDIKKPYNRVSIFDGAPGSFNAGARFGENIVEFSSDETAMEVTPYTDGSIEFRGKNVAGEVTISDAARDPETGDLDMSTAQKYSGTVDFFVRCLP